MQSTDFSTVEVDCAHAKLNGNNDTDNDNDNDDIDVPKTLNESGEVLNQTAGVDEESIERDEGNEDMEVDFVEISGARAVFEGPGDSVEGRVSSSLEGERGFVNVEGNGAEDSGSKAVLEGSENFVEERENTSFKGERGSVIVEENGKSGAALGECSNVCGVENGKECGTIGQVVDCAETVEPVVDSMESQGSLSKLRFNSIAQQLFPKAVNEDIVGKQVMMAGIDGSSTIIGDVVEGNEPSSVVENDAIGNVTSDFDSKGDLHNQDIGGMIDSAVAGKENIVVVVDGGYIDSVGENQAVKSDTEGGFANQKGVDLVVDLDSAAISRGKKAKRKGRFCSSDLVWGKVRSHPWWPGEIFEPEDASDQANKHFRSNTYLVAYFGDQSFAWNDEVKLKPFAPHFSQMAKQSTAEAFLDAVNCALDEAAGRAEFGLSCPCIDDDVYSRLKVQVMENAGVREKIRMREGVDRLYCASTFEPVKFLDYVKSLAVVPHVEDKARLEHVVSHAQMSALYSWKGLYHLAEFTPLLGYVNNEADAPPVSRKTEEMHQLLSAATIALQEKIEEGDIRPQKRKKSTGDSGKSTKKVKHLSEPKCRKGKKEVRKQVDGDETEGETDENFILSSLRRCKGARLPINESKSKERILATPSRETKTGIRVGESILRAAQQLSQPSPLLKLDVSSHGTSTKGNSKSKQHIKQTKSIPFKKSSLDDILSKFLLVAVEPLEEHSFLSPMIRFFSNFRDSVVQDIVFLQKDGESESYDIVVKPEKMNEITSSSENVSSESGSLYEDNLPEESPTALTLKFTDMDSIPTEAKLIKIFTAFGPLKESETEVLPRKNCARVVFKRRVDAETAFSSSGKFETFGPSLVCYQLNYAPSPRKSPSPEAKRRRKDETVVEIAGA